MKKNKLTNDALLFHMTIGELNETIRVSLDQVMQEHIKPPSPLIVITLPQASEKLKVHRHTLRVYSEQGIIDCFHVGNRRMFTLEALEKFIRSKGSEQPAQQRARPKPSKNK